MERREKEKNRKTWNGANKRRKEWKGKEIEDPESVSAGEIRGSEDGTWIDDGLACDLTICDFCIASAYSYFASSLRERIKSRSRNQGRCMG